MTQVAWRQSGLMPSRVIGAGCNLDSERLNYLINIVLTPQSTGKQGWVIGELSDNKGTAHLSNLIMPRYAFQKCTVKVILAMEFSVDNANCWFDQLVCTVEEVFSVLLLYFCIPDGQILWFCSSCHHDEYGSGDDEGVQLCQTPN